MSYMIMNIKKHLQWIRNIYTSCGRLRSMLGRGDISDWLAVEVVGSVDECGTDWWLAVDAPSTTYAGWTERRDESIATMTCATFPDVFSSADECWLTTIQQTKTQ